MEINIRYSFVIHESGSVHQPSEPGCALHSSLLHCYFVGNQYTKANNTIIVKLSVFIKIIFLQLYEVLHLLVEPNLQKFTENSINFPL